jgi:hypothetical protein
MYGGKSTGPRTKDGLERMRGAKTSHGLYSEKHRHLMRMIRDLNALARQTLTDMQPGDAGAPMAPPNIHLGVDVGVESLRHP